MNKFKKVDEHVKKLIEDNKALEPADSIKLLIIWKKFSMQVKPSLKKMNTEELILFASNFILFVIQFESICMRAHLSINRTSVSDLIIHMYKANEFDFQKENQIDKLIG